MAVIDSFSQWDDAPRSTLFTVYCRFKGKVRILLFFVYLFVCFIEICYSKHLNTVHKRKKSLNFNTLHVANCTTAAFWNEELEEVFQDEKDGPCLKLDCRDSRKTNIFQIGAEKTENDCCGFPFCSKWRETSTTRMHCVAEDQ